MQAAERVIASVTQTENMFSQSRPNDFTINRIYVIDLMSPVHHTSSLRETYGHNLFQLSADFLSKTNILRASLELFNEQPSIFWRGSLILRAPRLVHVSFGQFKRRFSFHCSVPLLLQQQFVGYNNQFEFVYVVFPIQPQLLCFPQRTTRFFLFFLHIKVCLQVSANAVCENTSLQLQREQPGA